MSEVNNPSGWSQMTGILLMPLSRNQFGLGIIRCSLNSIVLRIVCCCHGNIWFLHYQSGCALRPPSLQMWQQLKKLL